MGKKRKKEKKFNYFFLFLLLSVIAVLVFFNFKLYNERKVTKAQLERSKEELERVSFEHDYMKGEEEINIEEYIERVAREQLLLRKEGENVIVIAREEEEEEEEEEEDEETDIIESFLDIFRN